MIGDKVPDLFYDLYARLIPGVAFLIAIVLWLDSAESWKNNLTLGESVLFLGAGFFVGLAVNPISSRLFARVQRKHDPRIYIENVQTRLDRSSRDSMLIAKMKAETIFCMQCAVLGFVLGIMMMISKALAYFGAGDLGKEFLAYLLPWSPVAISLFLAAYFYFFAANDFARRRHKRALRNDPDKTAAAAERMQSSYGHDGSKSDRDDPKLRDALERLVRAYKPERIYLFGSAARRAAGPDSDYDLMIIVPDDAPRERCRAKLAYSTLRGSDIAADVLVWKRSSFDSRIHLKASLPGTIIEEGKLLYAA